MAKLGTVIAQAIILHYGRTEFLRRLANPFWFQSFGAVMGMDWHSSGITTSVIGALNTLQSNWHAIPAFLRWDIETTSGVLDAAKPLLDAGLVADITAAQASIDLTDLAGLEPQQVRMRGLLVEAMPAVRAEHGAAYGKMMALFRERTDRFPFVMAIRPPAKKG